MESTSLAALAHEHLETARTASSGRSAHTVHGGHGHVLRQTLIALLSGHSLADHESPGDATLQVLQGRVRLVEGAQSQEAVAGDIVVIPDGRHSLDAIEDSVVLLTVAQQL